MITECLAFVLSLVAIGVSVWTMWENRRHNRLSFTPVLRFDESYVPQQSAPQAIWLVNRGLGPARILKMTISYGDTPTDGRGLSDWRIVIDTARLDKFRDKISTGIVHTGDLLSSQERIPMLVLDGKLVKKIKNDVEATDVDDDVPKIIEGLRNLEANLEIEILYSSLYGEEQPLAKFRRTPTRDGEPYS